LGRFSKIFLRIFTVFTAPGRSGLIDRGLLGQWQEGEMKTSIRIFLCSLGAALIGFWPAGADAQTGALVRCGLASPGSILGAARAAMIKRTIKCLQATGQAPAAGPAGVGGQFVTFDPPGSTSTTPVGITPDGTIAGYYCDTAACVAQAGIGAGAHGFLRERNGSFTTFDPPGSTSTYVGSISTNGEIAGAWCETSLFTCARPHGFVRAKNGTFTTFDSPDSSGGVLPGYYCCGAPPSINPAGTVAGMLYGFVPGYYQRGFIRDKNGALTTIDAPGTSGITQVFDINPSGAVIGETSDSYTASYAPPTETSPRSTLRALWPAAGVAPPLPSIRRARSRGRRSIQPVRST
jgi:hypothetical protein